MQGLLLHSEFPSILSPPSWRLHASHRIMTQDGIRRLPIRKTIQVAAAFPGRCPHVSRSALVHRPWPQRFAIPLSCKWDLKTASGKGALVHLGSPPPFSFPMCPPIFVHEVMYLMENCSCVVFVPVLGLRPSSARAKDGPLASLTCEGDPRPCTEPKA